MSEKMDDLLQGARRAFVSDAEHAAWADALRALIARGRADAAETMRTSAFVAAGVELVNNPYLDAARKAVVNAIRALPLPDAAHEPQPASRLTGAAFGVPEIEPQAQGDPELDATDFAHPAWWRGHEHTAKVFCSLVNDILDGKDNGAGFNYEPWGDLRRRLLALAPGKRVPEGWKPIETAPKDGAHVILFDPTTADEVLEGGYREDMLEWVSRTGMILHPLNWMPLPAPPSDGGKE